MGSEALIKSFFSRHGRTQYPIFSKWDRHGYCCVGLQVKVASTFKNPAIRFHETAPQQFYQGSFLLPDLASQLDLRQALYRLVMAIAWKSFEEAFGRLYSSEGRSVLQIRRMVGF